MKTLQEQYNLIKEGKGNKNTFMKSARASFQTCLIIYQTLILLLEL